MSPVFERFVAAVIGLFLVCTTVQEVWSSFLVNSWADGVILSSEVKKNGAYYEVAVKYEYSVDGKIYFGDKLESYHYGYYVDNERMARNILAQFPSGKKVHVNYWSVRPESSMLSVEYENSENGGLFKMFFYIGLALVWHGLGWPLYTYIGAAFGGTSWAPSGVNMAASNMEKSLSASKREKDF
jgi:hypothetical protein